MSLSNNAVVRMITALADSSRPSKNNAGNEVCTAVNAGSAFAAASGFSMPAIIIAAHVSATTDFGALKVADYVVHIPASAGNAIFYTVVTAGTLPAAAVVGDMYVVFRAFTPPAASDVKL